MTKTKAELRQAHGTPVQFRRAVNKAIAQGTVGITKGQAAVLKYNREYAAAPDERGMIFTGESVNGIMAGTKTMTRRIVKVELPDEPTKVSGQKWGMVDGAFYYCGVKCPYGVGGDRLWVREAWRTEERASDMVDGVLFQDGTFRPIEDSGAAAILWIDAHANGKYGDGWRLPMFMPRWASRLTLEITGIRVERLQDITEEDAITEGISGWEHLGSYDGYDDDFQTAREVFRGLWDKLNGKHAPWKENPWVWVISFKKLDSHPIPSI